MDDKNMVAYGDSISKAAMEKIESLSLEREKREQLEKEQHEYNMANDVEYRRYFYQTKLYNHFSMLPRERYYKSEYAKITQRYNKAFDTIATLSDVEDMEKVFEEFVKKSRKVMSQTLVFNILWGLMVAAIVGFVLYCMLSK